MFILRSSNAELTKYEYNKGKSKTVVCNRQIKREYFCFCRLPDACCYFLNHKILCVPWGQAFVLQLYRSVCLCLSLSLSTSNSLFLLRSSYVRYAYAICVFLHKRHTECCVVGIWHMNELDLWWLHIYRWQSHFHFSCDAVPTCIYVSLPVQSKCSPKENWVTICSFPSTILSVFSMFSFGLRWQHLFSILNLIWFSAFQPKNSHPKWSWK